MARPGGALSIGPGGGRGEPIMDPTKIAIAFFTTLAAMFVTLSRIKRQTQDMA